MTCQRCGAPLPAGARFCAACGAPAPTYTATSQPSRQPVQWGAPGAQPNHLSAAASNQPNPWARADPQKWGQPGPPGQPQPYGPPERYGPRPGKRPRAPVSEGVVRAARVVQLLAAIACLVHGLLSITLRRAAFVDVSEGRGGSASSDQLNTVLLTLASVLAVIAVALALLVMLRGRGRSGLSGAGLALFGIGWLIVLVGAALLAGADTRAEAETAALATVLVGIGFLVVGIAHGLLAAGLKAAERDGSLATAPYPGPDPYAGTPLARNPQDRHAFGAGVP